MESGHCRVLVVILSVLCSGAVSNKNYSGYQLLQLSVDDVKNVHLVNKMKDVFELDIWSEGAKSWDVLVSPGHLGAFQDFMEVNNLKYTVKNADIQRDIDAERKRLALKHENDRRKENKAVDYNDFNTYADIMFELDNLAARCPAELTCETFVTGQSVERREIKGLRIYRSDQTQKTIWIDATIHAREWLSTATHMKIMSHLIDDYATDAQVRDLTDRYEWYLEPIINPDGYSYTWTSDRLWRKSRNINSGSSCYGTDLNRNFDHMWGNSGSSALACSDTFRGPGAGSEPETQALSQALVSLGPNLLTSIHLHTYSQFWLIPWGGQNADGSCMIATDDAEMMVVANAAADATQNTFGTTWARGNWCVILYPASGNQADYSKGVAGVKYTFTPELRGNSFIVNKDQIPLAFQETWNGVVAAITAIESRS